MVLPVPALLFSSWPFITYPGKREKIEIKKKSRGNYLYIFKSYSLWLIDSAFSARFVIEPTQRRGAGRGGRNTISNWVKKSSCVLLLLLLYRLARWMDGWMELKLYSPPILLDVVVFFKPVDWCRWGWKKSRTRHGTSWFKLGIRITRQSFSGRPSSHTQMWGTKWGGGDNNNDDNTTTRNKSWKNTIKTRRKRPGNRNPKKKKNAFIFFSSPNSYSSSSFSCVGGWCIQTASSLPRS
jgi:hypothetical protein